MWGFFISGVARQLSGAIRLSGWECDPISPAHGDIFLWSPTSAIRRAVTRCLGGGY
jgi:hypothetical protein